MAQNAENQRENHYYNITHLMLNWVCRCRTLTLSVCISVLSPPLPHRIGEKGEPKTTIQGWPLALVGCFGCVCVCFAAVVLLWWCAALFIVLLASVTCPRCLGWLAWHGSTDDDRMMAGAWRRGATTRMGVRGWNDTRPCIEHKYESM